MSIIDEGNEPERDSNISFAPVL